MIVCPQDGLTGREIQAYSMSINNHLPLKHVMMKEIVTTEKTINQLPPEIMGPLVSHPAEAAKAIDLVYVNDGETPGITREKHGNTFRYFRNGKEMINKKVLDRIRRLVIPPAWSDVWICPRENGHLQVTGFDGKGRKQYIYHPAWISLRNHSKFDRMIRFGRSLPEIRSQVEKDLARRGLPREKVLAAVVSLMESTNIRVGNHVYEKLNGTFGLTTLKDRHIDIKGHTLRLSFKGKKGVYHDISLRDRRLANIVQRCKEIPGKVLFQYYDEEGQRQTIDSGMVNTYIRKIGGADFTSKDFRTWAGTVNAFLLFLEAGPLETKMEIRNKVVETLDKVASLLGNTRSVCRKYYVHPLIISMYEDGTLHDLRDTSDAFGEKDHNTELTKEEKLLLSLLEKGQTPL